MNALPEKVEIFCATSGFPSARLRWPDGVIRLLHSAEAPERESEELALPDIWAKVLICLGTGLGYHLHTLLKHPNPLLIVLCEAWPELLGYVAGQLEGSGHTVIALNPRDALSFQAGLAQIPSGVSLQWLRHPASYRMQKNIFEPLEQQILARILPHKSTRTLSRTLLLHGQHFLQEEIYNGLLELGKPVQQLAYDDSDGYGIWESKILRAIQEFRPDQILSVNMKGIDPEGVLLSLAAGMGVAVHVWFVDDPRPIALAQAASQFPLMHAWCWERAYLPWLRQKGFIDPQWLPLAGDPHLFNAPASPIAQYRYDLVFTGSSMGDEYLAKIKRSFLWDERLAPLVELRAEEYLRGACTQENLLDELALPFQDERNLTWLICLIQHTASFKKRVRYLSPLVDQGLVCAGDSGGWKKVFGVKAQTLADINYRSGLALHYQSCRVNLNLTSCQMPQTVNQRVFDVPLSGSFLLTDQQQDLSELFDPSELATFSSPGELLDKSAWFLSHADERERISAAARKRILGEHTYAHRLKKIC